LVKQCATCREWRCKSHCRCGRQGTALGRRAPRQAVAKAKAKAAPRAVTAPRAAASSSSSSSSSPQVVFNESTWLQQCLKEMQNAATVQIASLVFDEPSFSTALLKLLRGPRPFTCRVVVDKDCFYKRVSTGQRPRLLELQKAGALVRLATGHSGTDVFGPRAKGGMMHLKAVVLDGNVVFSGSANVTRASLANRELVFRLVGPDVKPVLEAVADAFRTGQMLTERD
jgi:phosphatidylserine/phosphatidylglycerophosphate/cardiolipin synthase-like enzyme